MEVIEVSLADVVHVLGQIPEFMQQPELQEVESRCLASDYLAIGIEENDQLVAVKLGYALNETVFYSWLGAVMSEFRQKGYAKALLVHQERWAAQRGFRFLKVKSMNCYPEMMSLLINNGYPIIDLEGGDVDRLKVHFQKTIHSAVEEVEYVSNEESESASFLQVISVELLGAHTGRVRDLKGFRKSHHKVPDRIDERTQRFVETISAGHLEFEGTALFQSFRESLGYKRKEIQLDVDQSSAKITTKDFECFVHYSQSQEDASLYQSEIRLCNISKLSVLEREELDDCLRRRFNEVRFCLNDQPDVEAMIDLFESADIDTLKLSYPPDCSRLELKDDAGDWTLLVTPAGISIMSQSMESPSRLAEIIKQSDRIFSSNSKFRDILKLS